MLLSPQDTLALYVHWPFCKSKCPYCDFNSHVRDRVDHPVWARAFTREMEHARALTGPRTVKTVFFGGGTPSLMAPETVSCVLETARRLWNLDAAAEVTLEANPTSVEAGKFRAFRAAGVNRVSLGIQSLDDEALGKLGRQHSAAEALAALETAAGIFDRFSFDLIYARSGQTPEAWSGELHQALRLAGGHLSLYQLTIEEGTLFHTLHRRGELPVPEEEEAARFYEVTQDIMAAHGLPAYEISNHARQGQESRHNLVYWHYGDYAGIGPGAHGRLTLEGKKWATRGHRAPEPWLERVAAYGHGWHPMEEIAQEQRPVEALLSGLRLTAGIDSADFLHNTGFSLSGFLNPARVRILTEEGFLEQTPSGMRATAAGRLRLNALLGYLLAQ